MIHFHKSPHSNSTKSSIVTFVMAALGGAVGALIAAFSTSSKAKELSKATAKRAKGLVRNTQDTVHSKVAQVGDDKADATERLQKTATAAAKKTAAKRPTAKTKKTSV